MNRSERFIDAYGTWVIRHRWRLMVSTLLVAGALSAGAPRMQINENYRVLFNKANPQLLAYERIEEKYTSFDTIFFVLAPADGDVFTESTLSAVEELTEKAWTIPCATRVDSLTNFQHSRAEGDDILVGPLIEDMGSCSPSVLQRARETALAEPALVKRLISPAGDVTGVNVSVRLPERRQGEQDLAVADAHRIADEMRAAYPGLEIHLAGIIMFNDAFKEAALRDLRLLAPLMYLGVVLTVLTLLRSLVATMVTMLVVALSTTTGMGLAGWLGMELTGSSAAAPTMILTLAVADSIHIWVTLLRGMRQGQSQHDALQASLRANLPPVFLTTLTTVIGFLTMNFSDAPPLRDLGNMTAMGITAAFVYSVVLLPALVAMAPIRVKAGPVRAGPSMDGLARFVVSYRKPLLCGAVLLVVALPFMIAANEINDQWIDYFDESMAFRQAADFAIQRLTGPYLIVYSLEAGEPEGITSPEYLATMDAFAQWFRRHPDVGYVNTFSETMKRLNRNMHGDDPAWYRLPESRELAAQYLLLYEMSLPYGLPLNRQVDWDHSAVRFVASVKEVTSNELRALAAAGTQWLQENAPPTMISEGTGPGLIFAHHAERNIHGMIRGTALAFVLIAGVMLVALRNVKYGLLSLIPNVVPAAAAFGLWGVCVGYVGFALSTVSAMTLGIVVDDTIHYLSKYVFARRHLGKTAVEAVHYAFNTVGGALVATSLILGAGFFILSRSTFAINSDVGLLATIVIGCALAADFFLLPPLLLWLDLRPGAGERAKRAAGPVG